MALNIDLSGKRALITGATGGVGLGVARMLARAGCDCAGCGLSAPGSQEAEEFIEVVTGEGRRPYYFQCDMTDEVELREMTELSIGALGGLDAVVSSAGTNVFEGVETCSEEDWARNMNLNLTSHWRLAKLVRSALEKSGDGTFLVMTSNHAFRTIQGCFPYNVAKTALLGLVRALCIEWAPGIRVVGIAPGFIDTNGGQGWFDSFADPKGQRARTEASHPVGRLGTPDEVGALCAFLSSSLAGFVSGSTVLMDGGRSAIMQDDNPIVGTAFQIEEEGSSLVPSA